MHPRVFSNLDIYINALHTIQNLRRHPEALAFDLALPQKICWIISIEIGPAEHQIEWGCLSSKLESSKDVVKDVSRDWFNLGDIFTFFPTNSIWIMVISFETFALKTSLMIDTNTILTSIIQTFICVYIGKEQNR